MNKKRLLSLVLTFALVFTTVFAGAGSAFAGEKVSDTKTGVVKVAQSSIRTKAADVEESEAFTAKSMLYSTTKSPEYTEWTLAPNEYVLTSVTAKDTGVMYIDHNGIGNVGEYDNAQIYMIKSCEFQPDGTLTYEYYQNYKWYTYAGEKETFYYEIPVTKGKKYKFLILTDGWNKDNITVQLRGRVYTTGQRTLSEGTSKWTIASGVNKSGEFGKATWFKVKAAKSGVMTVSLKEYGSNYTYGKVKLYSAEKNARSEEVAYSSSGSKVKFGVKKGRTYYLKVTECDGYSDNDYKFGIRYTISSATDRNIGTKAKAKRLYRKAESATKSLFVAANENSVDYYKFTVKTARKTKVTVKTNNITSGYVIMRLYKSNGKLIKKLEIPAQREGYIYTTGNLAKGTYYVKITKSTKASGSYTVRWTY